MQRMSSTVRRLVWMVILILGNPLMTSSRSNSLVNDSYEKADTHIASSFSGSVNQSKSNDLNITETDATSVLSNYSKGVSALAVNYSESLLPKSSTVATNQSSTVSNSTLTFATTACNSTNTMQVQVQFSSTLLENGMIDRSFFCCNLV